MRHEYRIRWRQEDPETTAIRRKPRLRYEIRQTKLGARGPVEALMRQSDEDYCTCISDMSECPWCRGVGIPASDIRVFRRLVGEWEEVPLGVVLGICPDNAPADSDAPSHGPSDAPSE